MNWSKLRSKLSTLAVALCAVGLATTAVCQVEQTHDKLWFDNPSVQAKVVLPLENSADQPHYFTMGSSNIYFLVNHSGQGWSGMSAYKVDTLTALTGTKYLATDNIAIAVGTGSFYDPPKGSATSDKLGLAVMGMSGLGGAPYVYNVLKMTSEGWTDGTTTNWVAGQTAFPLYTYSAYASDGLDFNDDGTALYGDNAIADENRILKYTWDTLTAASNTLTVAQNYTCTTIANRIRGVNFYTIGTTSGTNEFLFVGEGDGGKIVSAICVNDADSANWTEQKIVDNAAQISGNVATVKVTGIGTGRMHMYVCCLDGTMAIYKLSVNSGIFTATFVKKLAAADINKLASMATGDNVGGNFRQFEVTDDGLHAIFYGGKAGVYKHLTVVSTASKTLDTTKLWFNAPLRKSLTKCGSRSSSENSHYMDKGADDKYFVLNASSDGDGALFAFDMAKLEALEGTNAYSAVDALIGYAPSFASVFGESIRSKGVGVHDALGYAITGRGDTTRADYYGGYNLGAIVASNTTTFKLGQTAFKVKDSVSFVGDKVEFSLDGTCVYMNQYSGGTQTTITRFTYDEFDNTNKILTVESSVVTSSSRVRSMDIYELGGSEVLFYGEGSTGKATTGTIFYRTVSNNSWGEEKVLTKDTSIADNIMGVKVSGVGYDKKYLYVFLDTTAVIRIYELKVLDDGTLTATFEKAITKTEVINLAGYPAGSSFANLRNFEVNNSGEYGFLANVSQTAYNEQALAVVHTSFNVNQALVGDVTSSVTATNTPVGSGGDFVATYTATSGWISSIYTNGAPAYDCSAKPTQVVFTNENVACDYNIVVATSEARPDADAWYVNPGLTVDFAQAGSGDAAAGFHWGLDATDDFLAAPVGFTGLNSALYSVKSLESGSSSALGAYTAGTLFSADVRGAAVSKPLNVQLVGSALGAKSVLSLPLNTAAFGPNTNAFKIWTSNGTTPDAMRFTADGQYLYANAYAPSAGQNYIYKYRVLNGLKSSGTNLVLEATWTVGIRVRDMTVAHLGGKDIVYINANSALYVLDTSSTGNTPVSLGVSAGSNYAGLTVAGIGANTPHLYSFRGDTGKLDVYTIKADFTVETTPFKSYTGAELGAICGYATVGAGGTGAAVAATDDEATLFLGANVTGLPDRLLVIRSVPLSYPDWITNCGLEGEALTAMQAKYDAWAAGQTVTDLMTVDYSAQFLVNADATATVALVITNITLDAAGDVTLAIEGTADAVTLDLADINGVLYLSTATDLAGTWSGKTFGTVLANIGVDGIAVPEFAGSNGLFFKAAVGYEAPAGSTALTVPAD